MLGPTSTATDPGVRAIGSSSKSVLEQLPLSDNSVAYDEEEEEEEANRYGLDAKQEVEVTGAMSSPRLPAATLGIVVGRECEGLTDAEVAVCDAVCSIPMGRLQESLSLSHAVAVVLSQLFQKRLENSP
jgi:tRNA C32,U32 (ribose-2'-O)-methylase TrmJ